MYRLWVALLLVVALGATGFGTTVAVDSGPSGMGNDTAGAPRIVEVYPNPPTPGDAGEFVTLEFPRGADPSLHSLSAGTGEVPLRGTDANRTNDGGVRRLTYSTDVGVTERYTDRTPLGLDDRFQLADRGATVRLRRNGSLVDEIQYGWATEAEVYHPRRTEWRPLGATERPVVTAGNATVEAFVLPDAPDRVVEFLDSATGRISLAGYTFTSRRVVEALLAAHARGVTVEVLVDGSPVGGISGHAASALDELQREGVDVRVLDGDRARYRFHHAKYAVVDDRALVTSENWKPSGTGGRSSRGWAVITGQAPIVEGLDRTFRADTGWVDAIPWAEFDGATLVDDERARGRYPSTFAAQTVAVERTELLLAPDNAEDRIREVIAGAEHSLDIKQVQIGDPGFPLLREALAAAERGVEVRILLSGAWYAERENERLKRTLERRASREELPLTVRIAAPEDQFEKLHAKGVIVDGEQVLVGSINWNNNSLRSNREVALVLSGEEPAGYFGAVFDADWRAAEEDEAELPVGLALAVLGLSVLAILAASRIRFEDQP